MYSRVYAIQDNGVVYMDIPTPLSGYSFCGGSNTKMYNPTTKTVEEVKKLYGKDLWKEKSNGTLLNDISYPVQLSLKNIIPANIQHTDKKDYIETLSAQMKSIKTLTIDIETDPANNKVTCIGMFYMPENKTRFLLNEEYFGDQVAITQKNTRTLVKNERDMIRYFFDLYEKTNRVVVTYNGIDFDFKVLRQKAKNYGIITPFDNAPSSKFGEEGYCHVPHVDLYRIFSDASLKLYMFSNSYEKDTLREVSAALLKVEKLHIDFTKCTLEEMLQYNQRDLELTFRLFDAIITSLLFLSNLFITPLYEFMHSSISTWIENLLMYEYMLRGYLIMPKPHEKIETEQSGGLILTPPVGIFRNVDVLDVASMYPTIIAEYNLGPDTVNCEHPECKSNIMPGYHMKIVETNGGISVLETNNYTWVCTQRESVLAKKMKNIRDFRVNVAKPLSKKEQIYKFLNGACKVFMNATSGVMGSSVFRFHDSTVFNCITRFGQFALYQLITLAKDSGMCRVIYGATDSVFMIHNDQPSKKEFYDKMISYCREHLKLELEYEKTFKMLLFSGRKSNYVGIKNDGSVEIKGVTLKKSSVPGWFRRNFDLFLKGLVAISDKEDEYIKNFVMTHIETSKKELNNPKTYQNLEDCPFVYEGKYSDKDYKNPPQHIKAAEIDIRKHGKKYVNGDTIYYFKSTNGPLPWSEYKASLVDTEKYLDLFESAYSQILESVIPPKKQQIPKISNLKEGGLRFYGKDVHPANLHTNDSNVAAAAVVASTKKQVQIQEQAQKQPQAQPQTKPKTKNLFSYW